MHFFPLKNVGLYNRHGRFYAMGVSSPDNGCKKEDFSLFFRSLAWLEDTPTDLLALSARSWWGDRIG
jgi:hypothetical protein